MRELEACIGRIEKSVDNIEQIINLMAEDKLMNKRHKHYEVIVAWAEGKEIQFRVRPSDVWNDFRTWDAAPTFHPELQYRIKPEPKPDLVRGVLVSRNTIVWYAPLDSNLRLTFDGETGKLKQAEVIDGCN